MAMTGAKADPSCASSFEDLKHKRKSRYIIYTVSRDGTSISTVASEPRSGTCQEDFNKFSSVLSGEYATKCCYAVFDLDWKADDGHEAQKIMFVMWTPGEAKVRDKMLTTGSRDTLKRCLLGISVDMNATEASELTYEICLGKAKS